MDETTHVTDIQVQDKKKVFFYSTFPGGHICGPAWLWKNKFLIVETERGILCCSHSEGLEGPPGELSLLFLDEITKLIPIFLNRRRFIINEITSFQDVRRKVQKSKSKQSLSKKANNGKQIKVKSAWDNCWSVDTQKKNPPLDLWTTLGPGRRNNRKPVRFNKVKFCRGHLAQWCEKVMLKIEPAVNNGLWSPIEERFDSRFKFVLLVEIATKLNSVLLPLNCSSVTECSISYQVF